ncbi:MAG: CaiB/BaiF CoA-transferase family protein, partial [Hoeflea sp.]
SITGFGQTGPYAPRAGYDFIIQAMAGMMSITGEKGREPQKAGVAISDIFTGLYSVIAIQAALRHAEKTGEGQMIDMALFDTQAGILGNQNLNYLISGEAPVQMGNAHMNIAPYEVFPVSDGHVIIAVGNDGQFQRFCKLLNNDAMAADPDFQTNPSRVAHRDRLREEIIAAMRSWTKADMLAACENNAVPAGPINTIAEMFADPQAISRELRMDLSDRAGTDIPSVRAPILLPASPLTYTRPSPRLGEHTEEVLAELEDIRSRGPNK